MSQSLKSRRAGFPLERSPNVLSGKPASCRELRERSKRQSRDGLHPNEGAFAVNKPLYMLGMVLLGHTSPLHPLPRGRRRKPCNDATFWLPPIPMSRSKENSTSFRLCDRAVFDGILLACAPERTAATFGAWQLGFLSSASTEPPLA